jgi:adenine deaminase
MIAPGKRADIVLLDDLETCSVSAVFAADRGLARGRRHGEVGGADRLGPHAATARRGRRGPRRCQRLVRRAARRT